MKTVYKINVEEVKKAVEAFLDVKENKTYHLGFARHTLQNLRNNNVLSLKTLLQICNTLQIPPATFFTAKLDK